MEKILKSNLSAEKLNALQRLFTSSYLNAKTTTDVNILAEEAAKDLKAGNNRIFSKYGIRTMRIFRLYKRNPAKKNGLLWSIQQPTIDKTFMEVFTYVMNNCHDNPDRAVQSMMDHGYEFDISEFPSDAKWNDGKPKLSSSEEKVDNNKYNYIQPSAEKLSNVKNFLLTLKSHDGEEVNIDVFLLGMKKVYPKITKAARYSMLALGLLEKSGEGVYKIKNTLSPFEITENIILCFLLIQAKVPNTKDNTPESIAELCLNVTGINIDHASIRTNSSPKTPGFHRNVENIFEPTKAPAPASVEQEKLVKKVVAKLKERKIEATETSNKQIFDVRTLNHIGMMYINERQTLGTLVCNGAVLYNVGFIKFLTKEDGLCHVIAYKDEQEIGKIFFHPHVTSIEIEFGNSGLVVERVSQSYSE